MSEGMLIGIRHHCTQIIVSSTALYESIVLEAAKVNAFISSTCDSYLCFHNSIGISFTKCKFSDEFQNLVAHTIRTCSISFHFHRIDKNKIATSTAFSTSTLFLSTLRAENLIACGALSHTCSATLDNGAIETRFKTIVTGELTALTRETSLAPLILAIPSFAHVALEGALLWFVHAVHDADIFLAPAAFYDALAIRAASYETIDTSMRVFPLCSMYFTAKGLAIKT